MGDTREQESIERGLTMIRLLRTGLGVIVIAFVPLVYLLMGMKVSEPVILGIGIGWVSLGVIIELLLGFFRCPACQKYFHVRGRRGTILTSSIFTRKCMNCGIHLKQHG